MQSSAVGLNRCQEIVAQSAFRCGFADFRPRVKATSAAQLVVHDSAPFDSGADLSLWFPESSAPSLLLCDGYRQRYQRYPRPEQQLEEHSEA